MIVVVMPYQNLRCLSAEAGRAVDRGVGKYYNNGTARANGPSTLAASFSPSFSHREVSQLCSIASNLVAQGIKEACQLTGPTVALLERSWEGE